MQSYRTTFSGTATAPGSTSIILSPENSYLRQFVGRK
jgi:membrane protease subunit HflC